MRKDDPGYDAYDMMILARWRYAALFSLLLTTFLSLFGALWIWLRDGRLHDVDVLLVAWVLLNVVLIPAIKWDNSRT